MAGSVCESIVRFACTGVPSSVTDRSKFRPALRRQGLSVLGFLMVLLVGVEVAAQERVGQVTGFPIPRFVTLGAAEVNVRTGPGGDYPVLWMFVRQGYPVEVTQEFDNWRRVRDINGDEGWVLGALLSSRRYGVVRAADDGAPVPAYSSPAATASVAAQLQPGVMAEIAECREGWCRLTDSRFTGWVEQGRLWGVYPDETF
jgi:SH3-like domain-containing protein